MRKLAEAGRTYATLDDPTVLAVGDQEGCGQGLQAGPLPADGFCQGGDLTCITAVLTRDLRDIAAIEKLTELPKFVRLLAEHSGQLVNYQQLGGSIPVSHKTSQRYVALLEQVFLVATVQPWYTNVLKRIVKTPKLHFQHLVTPDGSPVRFQAI